MTAQEITNLVSTLGFPIILVGGLLWFFAVKVWPWYSEAVRREIYGSVFGHGNPKGEPFAERLAKALAIPHAVDDDSPVYECREVIALRDRGWVRINDSRKAGGWAGYNIAYALPELRPIWAGGG